MTDKATQIIANAMRSTGCYERVNIEDHAQTIRAALATARIELIEHPEPTESGYPEWDDTAGPAVRYDVWISHSKDILIRATHTAISPDEARSLAAALLAAAHTAETQP